MVRRDAKSDDFSRRDRDRRLGGEFGEALGDDALDDQGIEPGNSRWPRVVAKQPLEAFSCEALLAAPNASLGLPVSRMIALVTETFGAEPDDLRPRTCFRGRVAILDQGSKPSQVDGRDRDRKATLMPRKLHGRESWKPLNRFKYQISSIRNSS